MKDATENSWEFPEISENFYKDVIFLKNSQEVLGILEIYPVLDN